MAFPLLLLIPASPAQDPRSLIQQSLLANMRTEELTRDYTYLETVVEREYSGSTVSKTKSETFEVISLYGEPYRRLIGRDGKPLPPDEERKQIRKYDEAASERASETPSERKKRIEKFHVRYRRQRAMLQEVPDAYDFRMAGETKWNGIDAWMVAATPRKGFKPRDDRAAKILPNFKAVFYIAKSGATLLKIDAEAIHPVSFGLVIARLDKGARFQIERTRLEDSLWATSRVQVAFDARIALVKRVKMDVDISYSAYRKFQTDSRIVSASAGEP